MWHGLTSGEPDDNIEIVFADIITWLDKHANGNNNNATYESRQQLIQTCDCGGKNLVTVASKEKIVKRTHKGRSYLCGLKGLRLLHHSEIQIQGYKTCGHITL